MTINRILYLVFAGMYFGLMILFGATVGAYVGILLGLVFMPHESFGTCLAFLATCATIGAYYQLLMIIKHNK